MGKLLLDEYPIPVLPSLAATVGLHEAVILQQIHYWLQTTKHIKDGKPWIYNSVKDWREQMPFLSEKQIRTSIDNLCKSGIIITGNYNKNSFDRTKWYTIDYDRLNEAQSPFAQMGKSICPVGQIHSPSEANPFAPKGNTIPETTAETISETTNGLLDSSPDGPVGRIGRLFAQLTCWTGSLSNSQRAEIMKHVNAVGLEAVEQSVRDIVASAKTTPRNFSYIIAAWKDNPPQKLQEPPVEKRPAHITCLMQDYDITEDEAWERYREQVKAYE